MGWGASVKLNPENQGDFTLYIRIPGWARGELLPGDLYHYLKDESIAEKEVILKINGKRIRKLHLERGYAVIHRKWKKGDKVELELPMPVRLVGGNSRIEDTKGKVVIMRGPMVFCMEETDNEKYFKDSGKVYLLTAGLKAEYRDDLLGGVVSIKGFASSPTDKERIDITAIPYYAWANREQGQMRVWLPAKME